MKRGTAAKKRKQPNGSTPAAGATFDSSMLDQIVGHLTRVVQVRLFQLYYERLRHLRVSPGAFAVLTAVRSNPGVQHGALAHALAAQGPNLTKLVDKLVRSGWVERRSSQNDKRTRGHHLTARGRAKADAILAQGLAHDEFVTSRLTAAERKTLLKLLAKLERELAAKTRRPRAS